MNPNNTSNMSELPIVAACMRVHLNVVKHLVESCHVVLNKAVLASVSGRNGHKDVQQYIEHTPVVDEWLADRPEYVLWRTRSATVFCISRW